MARSRQMGTLREPFEAFAERAARKAEAVETGDLYHYTSADAVITGILATGTLRLGPYESMNDLWESDSFHPALSVHEDDQADTETVNWAWKEIDRSIRLHTKVACLTRDFAFPHDALDPDALRGWAHLSLWAHYGGRHSGVCLRFDRDKVIAAFDRTGTDDDLRFHGPVSYNLMDKALNRRGFDLGQAKAFGADALARVYARDTAEQLFFRKHYDWSNENEYRLVLLDQSLQHNSIDIRDALTGVVLGHHFPAGRLPALREALQQYPDVEIVRLRHHTRTLSLLPELPPPPPPAPSSMAKDPTTLTDRIAALDTAETAAHALYFEACDRFSPLIDQIGAGAVHIAADLDTWPQTEATGLDTPIAVPTGQRGRRPGVPGERVHLERGRLICTRHKSDPRHLPLPDDYRQLHAALAFQVLDRNRLRFHAHVAVSKPGSAPTTEVWRIEREVDVDKADKALSELLAELHDAALATRSAFDASRGLAEETG
ncbi:DUF2971 domain-containing protein [Kitasatospora sp. NPDC058218]|uniref:DUF2971 domain-containing protein n=1 Tax=Kitasatospora sp. NPDC058218 TaxID=3346385 RepID=UPI0036DD0BAE